ATDLARLAKQYAIKGTPPTWSPRSSIILIDGLDEAPFDLSAHIEDARPPKVKQILVAVRSAYQTNLRNVAPSLELAPFAPRERDRFLLRWFADDRHHLEVARRLVRDNKDIAEHTCIPLVATLVASLVENGYQPSTKAEIYDHRLRLLLEDWDRYRGVERS